MEIGELVYYVKRIFNRDPRPNVSDLIRPQPRREVRAQKPPVVAKRPEQTPPLPSVKPVSALGMNEIKGFPPLKVDPTELNQRKN